MAGQVAPIPTMARAAAMRFKRQERYGPRQLTDRQRAAYARKLVKEQNRYPLFAAHVAAEQRGIDEEAARREQLSVKNRPKSTRVYVPRLALCPGAVLRPAGQRTRTNWRKVARMDRTVHRRVFRIHGRCRKRREQARRLARIDAERAPARERILRQIQAQRTSTLDLR